MQKLTHKDNLITVVWFLLFFAVGSLNISFAITSGDVSYDVAGGMFSSSLWLLITGGTVAMSSILYPIYALTKNVIIVLVLSLISISVMFLFGIIGMEILLDLADDNDPLFMTYFYFYVTNYIVCGISVLSLINFLYAEYTDTLASGKSKTVDGDYTFNWNALESRPEEIKSSRHITGTEHQKVKISESGRLDYVI